MNSMHLFKKIAVKTLKVLIIFAFVTSLFILVLFSFSKVLGYSYFRVETNSMKDIFMAGDVIIVKKIQLKKIKNNDIITFRRPNTSVTVTHRVVEKDEENKWIKTKGDNNQSSDGEEIYEENIIGIYVGKIDLTY